MNPEEPTSILPKELVEEINRELDLYQKLKKQMEEKGQS